MKISKKQLSVALGSIFILIVSLAVMLCDIFIPLNLWMHPILNFLFCLFAGFGVLGIIIGIKNRSSWYLFIGAILMGLALLYAISQYVDFWIAIIIVGVLVAIIALISFISGFNKTEYALNASEDYKSYSKRKAEKEKQENDKENGPLPEIKSFK